MRKINRTKKNRRYRKKNKSFKIGGDIQTQPQTADIANATDTATDELTKKIEADHSLSNFLPDMNLGDSKVMQKVVDLSEALAIKTIDNTSEFLNIDLKDSEQLQKRLEEIKVVLNDPKNKELMRGKWLLILLKLGLLL